MKVIPETRCVY